MSDPRGTMTVDFTAPWNPSNQRGREPNPRLLALRNAAWDADHPEPAEAEVSPSAASLSAPPRSCP